MPIIRLAKSLEECGDQVNRIMGQHVQTTLGYKNISHKAEILPRTFAKSIRTSTQSSSVTMDGQIYSGIGGS
jgi:hypothetical protein